MQYSGKDLLSFLVESFVSLAQCSSLWKATSALQWRDTRLSWVIRFCMEKNSTEGGLDDKTPISRFAECWLRLRSWMEKNEGFTV